MWPYSPRSDSANKRGEKREKKIIFPEPQRKIQWQKRNERRPMNWRLSGSISGAGKISMQRGMQGNDIRRGGNFKRKKKGSQNRENPWVYRELSPRCLWT